MNQWQATVNAVCSGRPFGPESFRVEARRPHTAALRALEQAEGLMRQTHRRVAPGSTVSIKLLRLS